MYLLLHVLWLAWLRIYIHKHTIYVAFVSAHIGEGGCCFSKQRECTSCKWTCHVEQCPGSCKTESPRAHSKSSQTHTQKKQTVELSLARLAEDLLHGLNWIYEKNGEIIFLVDNADAAWKKWRKLLILINRPFLLKLELLEYHPQLTHSIVAHMDTCNLMCSVSRSSSCVWKTLWELPVFLLFQLIYK